MSDRKHFWIGNAAFQRMTGIKHICMDCGLGVTSLRDPEAKTTCPGVRQSTEPKGATK